MRQVTRKGLITVAAASGVLALGGGYAHADTGAAAAASNSPGVVSGNSIQVPVDVPVNVCGNSVNAGGALNPSMGNGCGNVSSDAAHGATTDDGGSASGRNASGAHGSGNHYGEGTGRHRASGATADGQAIGSPGVGSGNLLQAPLDIPLNLCGNSITIGGLLNPVFGNDCANGTEPGPAPRTPHTPDEP
ncbi:MAG TPA: chaplin, partial [Streptomyces sp.]